MAGRELAPGVLEQGLEPVGVELVDVELKLVPVLARDEDAGRQLLAQPRDVDLETLERVRGRALAPQLVDQPLALEGLVRMQQQHGEHGATLASPERYMPGPVKGLQRAKNAEVHARSGSVPLKVNVTALLPLCRCAETVPADHALQMALRLTTQEAVMGQVIPRQHPAVVLRSQYKAVLAMLCVALVADRRAGGDTRDRGQRR